jgi:UDPglucose 6-dehydrogenase
VASNPEFLREGSALHDTLYPDRVVLGTQAPPALELLYTLYQPILEQNFTPPSFLPRPEGLVAVRVGRRLYVPASEIAKLLELPPSFGRL